MISRRTAVTVAAAVCAVIGVGFSVVVLLSPSGKQRALDSAPAVDLTYPAGTLIEDEKSDAVLGADAYRVRGYGTDVEQADILAFFDTALAEFGYQQSSPTPGNLTRFQRSQPLRQYQSGDFIYRLYLLGVPYRLSRTVTITGYRHVLFTALSD